MTPRLTRIRLGVPLAVLTLASLLLGSAAPASAGVLTGTVLGGTGEAKVSGLTRARLEVFATTSFGNTSIGVTLTFRNATGTATGYDEVNLTGGALVCSQQLDSCTIDDQGGLDPYGRVDLAFTATGPKVKRDLTCFGSSTVYATSVRRKGVLSGTLRVATKSKKLGTIRNSDTGHRVPATVPFTIDRTTYNGTGCPAIKATCAERVTLQTEDFRIQASRDYTGAKRATTYYYRTLPSLVPDVDRFVAVSAHGTAGAALAVQTKASLMGATFGMAISSPYLSGDLEWTASSDLLSTVRFGCDATERTGGLSGTLTWRTPGRPKVVTAVSEIATATHLLGTVAP